MLSEHDTVVIRKQLSRSKVLVYCAQLPVCRIGIEACGRVHDWGRALQKLGHEVWLMAVQLLTPYRTKPKNDRNDAEAICAAVSRPHLRFVPIKTVEQQAVLTVHRARELLVRERTAVANQIRELFMEYGGVPPRSPSGLTCRAPIPPAVSLYAAGGPGVRHADPV